MTTHTLYFDLDGIANDEEKITLSLFGKRYPVQTFVGTADPMPDGKSGFDGFEATQVIEGVAADADQKGFLYLFSHLKDGFDAKEYRLDVYTPTGQHLFRQTGLVAGAIAVDLWRNVFALNFETITGPQGHLEPTISEWIPHKK